MGKNGPDYDHFKKRIEENLIHYFQNDLSKFEKFFSNLSKRNQRLFRRTLLFYLNHIKYVGNMRGALSGPFIIISFAIIESIKKRIRVKNKTRKNRERIEKFFKNNLSKQEKIELISKFELLDSPDYKKLINDINKNKETIKNVDFVLDKISNILFDARNNFVHDAELFYFGEENYSTLHVVIEKRENKKKKHFIDMEITVSDFKDIFLKGFFRHFGYKDLLGD